MNQLYGMGITGLSVMFAALVSGFRLKPYIDAGMERTPMTFAAYPAAIAAAIAVPVVLSIRWWTRKKTIDLGPISFPGNLSFIALGCLLYILIAILFFPYQPTSPPPMDKPASMQHVSLLPQ
ncbi:MAG: hypothetical protein AB7P69_09290 [Candidatus Binatia bacterium]